MIGYVYKIVLSNASTDAGGDDNICYIGSTTVGLTVRWNQHLRVYKAWKAGNINHTISIYPYFEQYGIDNFDVSLVKSYEVEDRKHLNAYETLWINKLKAVNKICPFYIKNISNINYRIVHKDQIKRKYNCGCGGVYTSSNRVRHTKTDRHQKWVNSQ